LVSLRTRIQILNESYGSSNGRQAVSAAVVKSDVLQGSVGAALAGH
jgi:hypothetical protein